ncbi:MAG: LUD domain-containing protein [Halobacteriaceae archaeon]
MDEQSIADFVDALGEVDTTVVKTTTDTFEQKVSGLLEANTIGTPLPFDGISLADLDVTISPSMEKIESATVGITPGTLGVIETGSITIPSRNAGDEVVSLYPPHHIAVLGASDIVSDIETAIEILGEQADTRPPSVVFETGPSATADMGEVVQGVHGPSTVTAVIITDQ